MSPVANHVMPQTCVLLHAVYLDLSKSGLLPGTEEGCWEGKGAKNHVELQLRPLSIGAM